MLLSFGAGISEENAGPAPCRKNCAHRGSMGIGRAIVKGLAAEGVQVSAVARRTALLEELAGEIERVRDRARC